MLNKSWWANLLLIPESNLGDEISIGPPPPPPPSAESGGGPITGGPFPFSREIRGILENRLPLGLLPSSQSIFFCVPLASDESKKLVRAKSWSSGSAASVKESLKTLSSNRGKAAVGSGRNCQLLAALGSSLAVSVRPMRLRLRMMSVRSPWLFSILR